MVHKSVSGDRSIFKMLKAASTHEQQNGSREKFTTHQKFFLHVESKTEKNCLFGLEHNIPR